MTMIGFGSTFGIEGQTPGVYVNLAEVTAIDPPAFMREAVETTHLLSTENFKEFIAGANETGDVALTLNWEPSASGALETAFADGLSNYQITAPNGVKLQFSGFFTEVKPSEITSGEKLSASATIKVSGKAIWVAA
jgi:hypothetical protein